jgi:hypothetical protein
VYAMPKRKKKKKKKTKQVKTLRRWSSSQAQSSMAARTLGNAKVIADEEEHSSFLIIW